MSKIIYGALIFCAMVMLMATSSNAKLVPNPADNSLRSRVDAPVTCDDISGLWYNQLNSEVVFRHGNGRLIHGDYASYVNTAQSQANSSNAAPSTGPLVGYLKNATLAFTVNWDNSGAITAWAGNCYVDSERNLVVIKTSWHLVRKQDSLADSWKGVLSGQDVFTRQRRPATCY
ncbi:avidin-like [Paramacrobiotus metropolitanus]|uniref:avidin-like n=1 Tax=Paramacrobiotus metropolitanus TaxID=2943436 RepID=UPI002445BF72|nr:avidin-like [Paramacrobiotus metropolitanus]